MQALWLENQKLQVSNDIPEPVPALGEALIKLRLAGICSTDLELVKGYYPFTGVLGHEFVGEVLTSPSDSSWVGTRVVGEINIICGDCASCRDGRPSHCLQRAVLGIKDKHGAFSEYFTLPLQNLYRLPDAVPDEIAVFSEPLAAALEIQEQVHIHPGDRVLLVGAGRLGLLIAFSLLPTGCILEVLVRHDRQRLLLEPKGIPCVKQEQVSWGRADIVIDASGSPDGFDIAHKAVRPRGTIVIKSTYASNLNINMSSIVVDEITLLGSRCGPFAPAIRYFESGIVDPSPLTEKTYPLSAGLTAFEHAARPGVLKILLRP